MHLMGFTNLKVNNNCYFSVKVARHTLPVKDYFMHSFNRIQFRFRLVAKFNHSHLISDIRNYIISYPLTVRFRFYIIIVISLYETMRNRAGCNLCQSLYYIYITAAFKPQHQEYHSWWTRLAAHWTPGQRHVGFIAQGSP